MANISNFLQDKDFFIFLIFILFMKSKLRKINGLVLKKRVFEVVFILELLKNIRVFNFYFINEIKNIEIVNAFEKSRLVI